MSRRGAMTPEMIDTLVNQPLKREETELDRLSEMYDEDTGTKYTTPTPTPPPRPPRPPPRPPPHPPLKMNI